MKAKYMEVQDTIEALVLAIMETHYMEGQDILEMEALVQVMMEALVLILMEYLYMEAQYMEVQVTMEDL